MEDDNNTASKLIEMKEILEFKENADYKKLSCDEIKVLRDYITNLQHTEGLYNQLLKDYDELQQCHKNMLNINLDNEEKITNLQQELENKCWDEASIRADVLLEQQDYKSRIEKAVEYINNNLLYSEDFDYDEEDNLVWQGARCDTQSEDLLNILNGRSDE